MQKKWSSFVSFFSFFLFFFFFCLFCFFVFKTKSYYVALAGLELVRQTRLASHSQSSACLCLQSVGIKGMHHHAQPYSYSAERDAVSSSFPCWACLFLPNGDVAIIYSNPAQFPLCLVPHTFPLNQCWWHCDCGNVVHGWTTMCPMIRSLFH